MGDLETVIAEKGPPDAAQQHAEGADSDSAACSSSWRKSLRRLLPEGFERHHVACRTNVDYLLNQSSDAAFSRLLIMVFLILISLVLTQIVILERACLPPGFVLPCTDYNFGQTWMGGRFLFEQTEILFAGILASLLVVAVFAKKMRNRTWSGSQRKEVPTICAPVQQV